MRPTLETLIYQTWGVAYQHVLLLHLTTVGRVTTSWTRGLRGAGVLWLFHGGPSSSLPLLLSRRDVVRACSPVVTVRLFSMDPCPPHEEHTEYLMKRIDRYDVLTIIVTSSSGAYFDIFTSSPGTTTNSQDQLK